MADFGRLANEIAIQYHQEQEKLTPNLGRKNSKNINDALNQNLVPNFFIQTSSQKSNRSNIIVS